MIALVLVFVFFFLLVFQTTLFPAFFGDTLIYDLLIVPVVYLGFVFPSFKGVGGILLAGAFMDCFSGGPFGLYITTYLWLYVIVALLVKYFHSASFFLIAGVIALGVLMENMVVGLIFLVKGNGVFFSAIFLKTLLIQLCVSALTGPPIFFTIERFHRACELSFRRAVQPRHERNDF